jgi:hypothetical protein
MERLQIRQKASQLGETGYCPESAPQIHPTAAGYLSLTPSENGC